VPCVSDGSTSSATALRGSYGCAGIHEVSDFYDSSPFVSRPAVDPSSRTLTDITSHANNTQSSDAALAAAHKGLYALYFISDVCLLINLLALFVYVLLKLLR